MGVPGSPDRGSQTGGHLTGGPPTEGTQTRGLSPGSQDGGSSEIMYWLFLNLLHFSTEVLLDIFNTINFLISISSFLTGRFVYPRVCH